MANQEESRDGVPRKDGERPSPGAADDRRPRLGRRVPACPTATGPATPTAGSSDREKGEQHGLCPVLPGTRRGGGRRLHGGHRLAVVPAGTPAVRADAAAARPAAGRRARCSRALDRGAGRAAVDRPAAAAAAARRGVLPARQFGQPARLPGRPRRIPPGQLRRGDVRLPRLRQEQRLHRERRAVARRRAAVWALSRRSTRASGW